MTSEEWILRRSVGDLRGVYTHKGGWSYALQSLRVMCKDDSSSASIYPALPWEISLLSGIKQRPLIRPGMKCTIALLKFCRHNY